MATPSTRSVSGTGYSALQLPNKNPEQMEIFRQLGMGSNENISKMLQQLGGIAGGGDEQTWQQLEAPALRQFGQLQGQIASRFSAGGGGQGAMSSRRGSGFNNAQSGAATDLAERLQGQRLGYQRDAQDQLMKLYQSLMGQDMFDTALLPKKKSPFQQFAEGIAPGLGNFSSGAGNLGIAKALGLF